MPQTDQLNCVCQKCGEVSPAGSKHCMFCGAATNRYGSMDVDGEPGGGIVAFGRRIDPTWLTVWLMGFFAVYLLLFVARLPAEAHPLQRLVQVAFGMSITAAFLICIDCDHLDLPSRTHGSFAMSKAAWFAAIALLWPIAYPLYFSVRSRLVEPHKCRLAIAAAFAFMVVFAGLWLHCASKTAPTAPKTMTGARPLFVNGTPVTVGTEPMLFVFPDEQTSSTDLR